MAVAMFVPSVAIISVGEYQIRDGFKTLNVASISTTFGPFYEKYKTGLTTFGIMSGSYFLMIFIAMLLMFRELFRLINNPGELNEKLQH